MTNHAQRESRRTGAALPTLAPLARSLAGPSALALVLTLYGLSCQQLVHRSSVDPHFPAALSDWFEARGFPGPWLVVDSSHPAAAALRDRDRFLAGAFAADMVLALVVTFPIWTLVRWLFAALRRKLEPPRSDSK